MLFNLRHNYFEICDQLKNGRLLDIIGILKGHLFFEK